eukprot:1815294-Pyramimonas_sp.AAC.1
MGRKTFADLDAIRTDFSDECFKIDPTLRGLPKNKLPWEYTAASESAKTTTEHAVGFVDPRGQAIQ